MKRLMKAARPPMHFVPQFFLAPTVPIRVTLVGAGGNGSQMLSALARIDHALRALGQKGLSITVWDPDTVEAPNVGRQLFTAGDLGQNKAECLVSRFNRLFGTDWKAEPKKFTPKEISANIIITCVDNIECRKEVASMFRAHNITAADIRKYRKTRGGAAFNEYNERYLFYWLDLGNTQKTGQAILGSNRVPQPKSNEYETVEYLPTVTELFNLSRVKEKDAGPSCSMAEALSKQDLFVNSVLVQTAASLLWSLLTDMAIDVHGFYVNLETYRTAPIHVKAENVRLTPGRHEAARAKKETATYEITRDDEEGPATILETLTGASSEEAEMKFRNIIADYIRGEYDSEDPEDIGSFLADDDETGLDWTDNTEAITFHLKKKDTK